MTNHISVIDTPYPLKDNTQFPLFTLPSPVNEDSIPAQEELILRKLLLAGDSNYSGSILNRDSLLMHYGVEDFISIDDFLKKVGKMLRLFGKGGMVDVSRVRSKVVGDWFAGRLNNLMK